MSVTGLYLHDAALAVASGGSLVAAAPSIVLADPSRPLSIGQPGRDVARLTPRLVSTEHWALLARQAGRATPETIAVCRAELARRIDTTLRSAPLQCAVSAQYDGALGALLAVARLAGIDIGGFHDAAVLAVAASGISASTLVLEIGLAHVSVTRVEVIDGEARRRAAVIRRGVGRLALQQAWLRMIGEAMVLATRFDPLHDAATEQRLYDQLDESAAIAARDGTCRIELATGRELVHVELGRDQFVEAARDIYRSIASALHELRPAGQRVNVLLDEACLDLPGLLECLLEMRGCRILGHSSALVARAATLLSNEPEADGTVSVQRGCRNNLELESAREIDFGGREPMRQIPPSHALWEGRAIALPRRGFLEIGRAPDADGIRLAEGLTGVSRLHCSLHADTEGVTLVPHTPQGTWLNEERVLGRVRVSSGDRLRIGTPGVVIDLIAVGVTSDGTSQG